MQYAIKIIITVLLVVGISEAGKRNHYAGAILASLPLTSILALTWLYYETGSKEKTAQLTSDITYMVLPSLTFFITLPILLKRDFSYPLALLISSSVTFVCYVLFLKILSVFRPA
ncbi:MAG: hypothetical protein CVV42_18115 [Candidatus Riflebacteria bacterium HGW-Riflebacteria-2]|jgi:hypothetical protein|nr:MAG: hypothetical protein CVV42_18115 [Candidatus Riflebacteria bacterium HGW-Riflebacteria-2]